MDPVTIGLLALVALTLMLFSGMRIAFATALCGFVGIWALRGYVPAATLSSTIPHSHLTNYSLLVLPLFIMMGFFAYFAGITRDLYWAARQWCGHLPGGLAIATVFGSAGFAAACGASTASAAVMGKIALPELKKYNYDDKIATGCVAAGGTLGILIPPSTGFIIYAILTEESIGQLFLAGILPGILLTLLFMITIGILTRLNPAIGPAGPRIAWRGRLQAISRSYALVAIILVVMGGIYFGWFTPVEAAAVGAFLTFALALARRRMTWETLKFCVLETIKTFAFVYLIVIGAFLFNPFLGLTGIPPALTAFIGGLDVAPIVVLLLIVLLYIILGTFLEGFSMLVLTIPILFPLIKDLGYDPIWFGALLVVVLEMSLISPPLGLNVFVVKGISDGVPMSEIFWGILPFWAAMLVCAALLILFPDIALLLPETMIR